MLHHWILSLCQNYMAQAAFVSWFLAQAIKFILTLFQTKDMRWERFVGSGGFPSSHTSLVVALTTAAGFKHGTGSDIFAICLVFSLVVMYDASGIRREAGRQAQILNQVIEYFSKKNIPVHLDGRGLKVLLGHTPFEVFGGALLGIAIASIQYYWFYQGVL